MAETNGPSSDQPAWRTAHAPCVYCGQAVERSEERCPHCRTSFSIAVRKASREVVGDWYYLDPRNPSGRGITFETLIKMIEKGRIRADSVVRGPTSHHDWMYAAEAPRLAKYLGMCPHCFAQAKPEETFCATCHLNMNSLLPEPQPGVPADQIKEPFHKAAADTERELAGTPASTAAASAATAAPTPTPRPALRLRPEPTPTATAAALADSSAPAERKSRVGVAAARRARPKLWLVVVLTWVTLVPVLLLGYFLPIPLLHDGIMAVLGRQPPAPPPPVPPIPTPTSDQKWIQTQLAAADKAEQAKDYAGAIRVYQEIIAKTGDTSWEKRVQDLRAKPEAERRARIEELGKRITLAQKLADDGQFEDALAVLKNISKENRSLLASVGVGVEEMVKTVAADQAEYAKQKEFERLLPIQLAEAAKLRTAKKPREALAAYKTIGSTFPAELVAKHLDLAKTLKELDAEVAAAPPPPPPKLPEPPTDQAAKAVADLMVQAADLEKNGKLDEALKKLEEVKTKFDEKFWPEAIDEKIKLLKAKIEALQFFGIK
ncbi:MAG TPA: hypothetical protein VM431_15520 [Phycisphaerae bacterium]|nr:hypothetical protein [Phycisphaerae bacterium]